MLVSPRVEVADEVATRVGAPHDVGLTDADFTADHASSSTLEPLLNLLLLGALDLSWREAASTVQDRVAYLVKPADRRVRRQRLQVDGPPAPDARAGGGPTVTRPRTLTAYVATRALSRSGRAWSRMPMMIRYPMIQISPMLAGTVSSWVTRSVLGNA